MINIKKTMYLLLALYLCHMPSSVHAVSKEQKSLYFKIDSADLMKDNLHFFYVKDTPPNLYKLLPEVFDLVPLPLLREKNVEVVVLKAVFMVNRAVGFFDHEHMTNERFVSHILDGQKVTKSGSVYKVSYPGSKSYNYHLRPSFDSDDISTLPQSRVSKIVATSKKLDIIALGASATIVNEFSNFSRFMRGGTSVTSYLSIKDNKTLVVHYKMMIFKKDIFTDKELRTKFLGETSILKKQIDSFKPDL